MKIDANTFDEYFAATGERQSTLRAIDQLIRTSAPHSEPVLFQGMGGGSVLGYGLMDYQTKSMKSPAQWPLISLANQKHYISLYICAVDGDGQYIAEKNADRLGKVSCGKSCIRFKYLEDIDQSVLSEIIADIDTRVTNGEKVFGI